MRHSYGSWLDAANVPTKLIQERLGHASAAFTMQTYVHTVPGTEDVAAQAISNVLRG